MKNLLLVLMALALGVITVFGQNPEIIEHNRINRKQIEGCFHDSAREMCVASLATIDILLKISNGVFTFEVYPTNTSDTVSFNYTGNGTAVVELSNSLGSVVDVTEGTSLNVSEFPAGVYFATLKVNGVATAVQRVEVQ